MTRDIQARAREVLESDAARAITATAVGEAIRRVGATRNQASKSISDARVSSVGVFAAGAGTATVAQLAARRIGRLFASRKRNAALSQSAAKVASGARKTVKAPRDAVDAFTSKLGSSSGEPRTSNVPGKPRRTRTVQKATRTRSGQASRSGGNRGSNASTGRERHTTDAPSRSRSTASSSRGASAKSSRNSNGSAMTSIAKNSRNSNGRTSTRSAKSSRSANGTRAKTPGAKGAARPAASRRS